MRDYRSNSLIGSGDFIASVSGSSGDYDLTLDDGTVIEEYDETASLYPEAAGDITPAAGDLALIGVNTGNRIVSGANCQVISAEVAAWLFNPADGS